MADTDGRTAGGGGRILQALLIIGVATPLLLYGIADWQFQKARTESQKRSRERFDLSLGPDSPPSSETFQPIDVVPPPPVVTGFETVSAQQASGILSDDELVLAVVMGDAARAWPLNMMTGPDREVFNDELNGRPIAATW